MMRACSFRGIAAVAGFVGPSLHIGAFAWVFHARFVERVGGVDVELANGTIDARSGARRLVHLQFGLFDDAASPAPEGGLGGWVFGTLNVTGASTNSVERRTPGRLAPFTLEDMGGRANGVPQADPFDSLTEIFASTGAIFVPWECVDTNGDGVPDAPAPLPVPRAPGVNEFASVYAITIDPRDVGGVSYDIELGGELWQRASWGIIGNPVPPDCKTGEPGQVIYGSIPGEYRGINGVLHVAVPGPAPLAPVVGVCVWWACKRRRRGRCTFAATTSWRRS